MFWNQKSVRITQSQPVCNSKCIQTHCEHLANDINALNEEYVPILLMFF